MSDKPVAWFWWVGVAIAAFWCLLLGAWARADGASWPQTILTVVPLLIVIPGGFFILGLMNKHRKVKG